MTNYFAITAHGLEDLLQQELITLGAVETKKSYAGVFFQAELETAYRICLWSRLASRVIWILREFAVRSDFDLYTAIVAVNWPEYFNHATAIVVDFNGTNEEIRNSQYGALKVKDAIMDRFERARLPRPLINKKEADLHIHVRLVKDHAILGIDFAGEGLHQRGYRLQSGVAPLRETNACALVLKSGWKPGAALFDPMCGSGTLLIEAAMIAANIAPGLNRIKWGLTSLLSYQEEIWNELHSQASLIALNGLNHQKQALFIGYDIDPEMIEIANNNARRAGVDKFIQFQVQDIYKIVEKPAGFEQGVILSNPPYGERLGSHAQLQMLYQTIGQMCKQFFVGSIAAFYSSSDDLLSCIGMQAHSQFALKNGALDCRLKCYKIIYKLEKPEIITNNKLEGGANVTNEWLKNDDSERQQEIKLTVAIDFANRLQKNIKKLQKWAKQQQISCYRLYDADLPNYNAAIDLYQTMDNQRYLLIQEYAAPKDMPEKVAHQRLLDLMRAAVHVTKITPDNVILKTRQQQKGKDQYQKLQQRNQFLQINEFDLTFKVNLIDYLDTGIFLDHRFTRKRIKEMAKGRHFLNLFAYTGTATVYAACGGAKTTTTVDMSNTYLNWAKDNMTLNKQHNKLKHENLNHQHTDKHTYIQADCLQWLVEQTSLPEHKLLGYDLIFIDPPTFSNSKRMTDHFDIQADHVKLLDLASQLLINGGLILFSNNKRHFKMDTNALEQIGLQAENITKQTLPLDFSHHQQIHNSWIIQRVDN